MTSYVPITAWKDLVILAIESGLPLVYEHTWMALLFAFFCLYLLWTVVKSISWCLFEDPVGAGVSCYGRQGSPGSAPRAAEHCDSCGPSSCPANNLRVARPGLKPSVEKKRLTLCLRQFMKFSASHICTYATDLHACPLLWASVKWNIFCSHRWNNKSVFMWKCSMSGWMSGLAHSPMRGTNPGSNCSITWEDKILLQMVSPDDQTDSLYVIIFDSMWSY